MIVFDCNMLSRPYVGLYTFTDELAKALAAESRKRGIPMGFYVPESRVGCYGDDFEYFIMNESDKRHGIAFPDKVDLFHAALQNSKYMPDRHFNGKTLVTIHDLNYRYEKTMLHWPNECRKYMRTIRKGDRFVTISSFAMKDIQTHYNLHGKKMDVIYNGLPCLEYVDSDPRYVPKGKFIFSVGVMRSRKNFHVLPSLLVGNDLELVIAGRHERENYESRILKEAERLGVLDRVHLTGAVTDQEKAWYMRHCYAFFFLSLTEGFGLPVVEAMSFGKPVFISDRTCLPEIGGRFAYYINHDFEPEMMRMEFAKGMNAYEKGQPTPEEIMEHAAMFSWTTAASEYFDVYEDMLRGDS